MGDEKYPESMSTIQLNDVKQVRALVTSLLGTNMPSAVEDSGLFQAMVDNFLTNLGANMFAMASQQRQSFSLKPVSSRRNSRGLINSEHALHSIRSGESIESKQCYPPYQPEFKIRNKLVKSPDKPVNHLNPNPRLPPLISVPSHKFEKKPPAKKPRETKKIDLRKDPLFMEKRERAARQRAEIRKRELEASLAKVRLVNSLSNRQQHERRLVLEANLAKTHLARQEKFRQRAKTKVIVVGGGLAGLSAAEKLLSLGFKNTIVLEASNRLGGRIHSVQFGEGPDHLVEMGVPAIDHIDESNSVCELASANNLLIGSDEHKSFQNSILRASGKEVGLDISEPANRYCKSIARDVNFIYRFIKSKSNDNVNLSYYNYIRERHRRLVNQMGGDFVERLPDISQAVKAMTNNLTFPFGSVAETFAADLLGYYRDMGNDAVRKRLSFGMSALLQPLTRTFKADTTKFNARVDTIDWSRVTKKHEDQSQPQVRVSCSDGRIFEADHVIMAIPLGHLKQNLDHIFVPSLPAEKQDVIRRVGFGTVSKVFLYYENPFWTDQINLLWAGTSKTQYRLSSRTIKVASLPLNSNVLEVSVLGDTLENMEESQIVWELTRIFQIYFQKEIPDPTAIKRTDWQKNPLFCGSHPFLSTQCRVQDLALLEKSIIFKDRPIILFAGDYTYKHYRCLTHSARASGIREAQRLANVYNPLYGFENTMQ